MAIKRKNPAENTSNREFVVTRVLYAPRELMFKVWTQPEHLKQWFSPKGFSVLAANMDFRLGGTYHYGMRMPNGQEMWGKWTFREIVPPERIIFIDSFSDAHGGLTRHPMNPNWPREMLSTITFTEQLGRTTVTIRWAPHNATAVERKTFDEGRDSMKQGWGGTMEQLTAYLAKLQKENN